MLRVRDGELDCLGVLFERHNNALFRYYARVSGDHDASKDLVQEVFMRILRYRKSFRGESQFATWMYRIARNAHIDQGRKWTNETPFDENFDQAAERPARGGAGEYNEQADLLRQALAKLPEDKREILILSKFQDLKYTDIAEILDCSVENVKVRVHRALTDLRKAYCQISGEPVQ
jgi:RNA polymerase sigma-70 factor (ECF subfamily)